MVILILNHPDKSLIDGKDYDHAVLMDNVKATYMKWTPKKKRKGADGGGKVGWNGKVQK